MTSLSLAAFLRSLVVGPVLGLVLSVFGSALPAFAQNPAALPPELKELQAAAAIQDPGARLKELERLRAAHPSDSFKWVVDPQILAARVALASALEEILALQKEGQPAVGGLSTMLWAATAIRQIADHPKAGTFDRAKMLEAVAGYQEEARKVEKDPAFQASLDDRMRGNLSVLFGDMDLQVARAQVVGGDAAKALTSLDAYIQARGLANAPYFLTRGEALEALERPKEAYEAYLCAALEGHKEGLRRARSAHAKLHGKEDGFDAVLAARSREIPFHPTLIKPGPGWKGKAVLAELFTGSECPPCVAADFAFDGLIESYSPATLVVLEYHLPIPAPDPMMNPASKRRQDYYGVNSTPTVWLDGQEKVTGGGSRSMAAQKYRQLSAKIAPLLEGAAGAQLKLQATRSEDRVEAYFEWGKAIEGVDYHLALVQGEQEHPGGNRIQVHKMVVRDLLTLEPTSVRTAFDLAASEKATDAYLTEFEKTSARFKGFKFPQRRAVIGRQGLKVVLFAQERASRKVLQAVVADVK